MEEQENQESQAQILTQEERQMVSDIADSVARMALYNGEKENCLDVHEFLAYEIIDLTEIKSVVELQRHVAYKVLKDHSWPTGVAASVSKYFDLLNAL